MKNSRGRTITREDEERLLALYTQDEVAEYLIKFNIEVTG